MGAATGIDSIICFSPDQWGDVRRPQHLMRRLAARAPVLYVEPPLSVASAVKRGLETLGPESRARLRRAVRATTDEVEDGVHVLTPLVPAPEHRLSGVAPPWLLDRVSAEMRRTISRRVRGAARSLGFSSSVVWFGHPMTIPDGDDKPGAMVVYDCVDRWADFPGPRSDESWRERLITDERDLVAASDVVFCSAEGLFRTMEAQAPGRAVMLRNGADTEHFAPQGRSVPSDIAGLDRPIVGFVGAIADWVDLDLVSQAARLRPDWSFVLVGPLFDGALQGDAGGLESVRGLDNVHLLGPRPYTDVPSYVEAFDVALIPFELSGLTEDVNPIKLYEYLAAGVPVVATPIPEVCGVPEVGVASNAVGFVREIEAAVRRRHDSVLQAKRVEVARANSWDARVEAAWDAMAHLPQKSPASSKSPASILVAEVDGYA